MRHERIPSRTLCSVRVVLFKAFQVLHGRLPTAAYEPEVVKAASGKHTEAITLLRFNARSYRDGIYRHNTERARFKTQSSRGDCQGDCKVRKAKMNYRTYGTGTVEFEVGSLYERLQGVSDQRKARGKRYELALILTLSVLAKLSAEDPVAGTQLREGLGMRREQMPHAATYRRVLDRGVDVTEHEDAGLARFGHLPQVLAILNDLVLSMLRVRGFDSPSAARRRFDACPILALNFILCAFR